MTIREQYKLAYTIARCFYGDNARFMSYHDSCKRENISYTVLWYAWNHYNSKYKIDTLGSYYRQYKRNKVLR